MKDYWIMWKILLGEIGEFIYMKVLITIVLGVGLQLIYIPSFYIFGIIKSVYHEQHY